MHFVISAFVAVCVLCIHILFTEMLPKIVKFFGMILGSVSGGYAIAILIRKLGTYFKWYKAPKLIPTFEICAAVLFVLVVICTVLLAKRRKKLG